MAERWRSRIYTVGERDRETELSWVDRLEDGVGLVRSAIFVYCSVDWTYICS